MKKILLLIIPLAWTLSLTASNPASNARLERTGELSYLYLTKPTPRKLLETNRKDISFRPRPLKVAEPIRINQPLSKLAEWKISDQLARLSLTIDASKASHLNLGFSEINLPESAHLRFFDARTSQLLATYQAADVQNKSLWTPLLHTEKLQIELELLDSQRQQFSATLQQIGFGTAKLNSDLSLKSGDCNIDFVCQEGDNWRDVGRAVARYIITDHSGSYVCTGTLLNNDAADQRPLFLTAAHCLVAENTVNSMVFYWNYQTSTCGGSPDGNLSQTQTGARFLSRTEGIGESSDFALVELFSRPDSAYNVYYSGWDARPGPAQNVVTIHHPGGDEKRISLDADALVITDFDSSTADTTADYYQVVAWDQGTTEGGSSGAGLWNLSQALIGTLSGGTASCTAPAESDWYGRMSSHWLPVDHPTTQLEKYLAPVNGAQLIGGMSSCDAAAITIESSNNNPAVNQQITLSATISGANAPYEYEWDLNGDRIADSVQQNPMHSYTVAGQYPVRLTVTDASQCRSSSEIVLTVPDSSEQFLRNGIKPSTYTTPTTSNGEWIVTSNEAYEGLFSLRSQIINEDSTSILESSRQYTTSGTLSFAYKVSSEQGYDTLSFYIDDVEQFVVSGEQDWTLASYPLTEGSHTLRWEYQKDASLSTGIDTAWVDAIAFSTDPTPPPRNPGGGGGGSMPLLLIGVLFILLTRRLRLFSRLQKLF